MKDKHQKSFMSFDDFISNLDAGTTGKTSAQVKKDIPFKQIEKKQQTHQTAKYPRSLSELLKEIIGKGASDLHINSGERPAARIHGDLYFMPYSALNDEVIKTLIYPLLMPEHLKKLEENGFVDFSYEDMQASRFRINVYKHTGGLGASLRYIPRDIPALRDLNLPPVIEKITSYRKGLVLITGATGSGKSTTLAAMINHINSTRRKHIITVEDPLEFIHVNQKSRITHREIGEHANDFAGAIISAMRSDPDVLMIGEMRDLETISQALRAAETGVLVLATLHTSSSGKAIDRIINIFPSEQQPQVRMMLAECLRAVVAQQLIKRIDAPGRVAATEVLLSTHSITNLIREGKTFYIQSVLQTSRDAGMHGMDYDLFRLHKEGKISLDAARAHCIDLKTFEQFLAGRN